MIHLSARGIRALWERGCGHLPELVIDGVPVLHAAPWRDEAAGQADPSIPLVDRRLGGTFACAPFGADDVDNGPPHGLSANAPWSVARQTPSSLTAQRAIARGQITATITLRDDHPVLYQTHILDLDAPCTFAHHPMIRLAAGGCLSTAPVHRALTFPKPENPGTDFYARGQIASGFMLESRDGRHDLRDYPAVDCEDFVALIHQPGLAWTAIARAGEGDTILMLKRSEQLPLTCLWISNRGRHHEPWNGRHAGVLGIEDARCAGAEGFAAALSGDSMVDGVPLTFAPGRHVIPHAILRLPGRHAVTGVTPRADLLEVKTEADTLTLPFDGSHFL
ncbi:MAG: hypothetical protein AAF919_18815 [Pseudomonadota bacterium]